MRVTPWPCVAGDDESGIRLLDHHRIPSNTSQYDVMLEGAPNVPVFWRGLGRYISMPVSLKMTRCATQTNDERP